MIWVIGCNGMLGSEVCRELAESGYDFVGSDRDVDFTDMQSLEAFAKHRPITCIVNCAAYTAVDKAEEEAELAAKLNVVGPQNIGRLSKQLGATVIHISTDYVFDGTGTAPYTEDAPLAPLGIYGKTKADGERALQAETERYYILRTAWLYGWAGKNFVYTMLGAMNSRSSVRVVNDQRGSPTFCGDLAHIILTIATQDSNRAIPYGIYHVTNEGETTWFEFTAEIKRQGIAQGLITNPDCAVEPCTTAEYPTPAQRPAYSVLSKQKIQAALGIRLPEWRESLGVFLRGVHVNECSFYRGTAST